MRHPGIGSLTEGETHVAPDDGEKGLHAAAAAKSVRSSVTASGISSPPRENSVTIPPPAPWGAAAGVGEAPAAAPAPAARPKDTPPAPRRTDRERRRRAGRPDPPSRSPLR